MKIELTNLGKKYKNEWIFRNVNLIFEKGQNYTFVGPNGSGKSTLLQVVSGVLPQTEGTVNYLSQNQPLHIDSVFKNIVIAAPYLELIEEFSLLEAIEFHQKFKKLRDNLSPIQFLELINLAQHKNKAIKNFSSGMKQRLKLGLAFHSDCPIILLDEPTSNLDATGSVWYLDNIEKYTKDKLLIICSNQPNEYEFSRNIVNINDYK